MLRLGVLTAAVLCSVSAFAADSLEGSGVYAASCTDDDSIGVTIFENGTAQVAIGTQRYDDVLTSYSFFGDATPPEFLIALLFDPADAPFDAPDSDPHIEIWRSGETFELRINGDETKPLQWCAASQD